MASNAITVQSEQQLDWNVINAVVTAGDLADLTVQQRTAYYRMFCESLGLNPVTQPFGYFKQNGKLTLYARKEATEQLRKKHNVSLRIIDQQAMDGLYIVTVEASFPDGRVDSDVGAVPLPQSGEPRSNAIMKAITKAKRRVTLSICGLGISDETEIESIPGAQRVIVDEDGVIHEDVPIPLGLRPEQWERLQAMARGKGVTLSPDMTRDQIAGAIRKAGGPAIPGQVTPRAIKDALDAIRTKDAPESTPLTDDEMREEMAQESLIGTGR